MNTTVPSARLKQAVAKKRSKLRVIDQGTRYDVTGRLRKVTREIERGELGRVADVMLVTCGGGTCVDVFHFGNGSIAKAHWMLDVAKGQFLR